MSAALHYTIRRNRVVLLFFDNRLPCLLDMLALLCLLVMLAACLNFL
jgi:hypothetical protein